MAPGPRITLGFLLDNLFDDFEQALFRSVVAAAREEDVSLVCVPGGSLTPPRITSRLPFARNVLFELVSPEHLDGLIVLTASIGILLEGPELEQFLSAFAPLPIFTLVRETERAPGLLVDNEAGIHAVMDHLVRHHGRRRVAFVRGPSTSSDAEERYRAYQSALAHHGIPFDPAYVFEGDFQRASGIQAIEAFWDGRGLRPDAIVAANDLMALQAMGELQRRGIAVPDEVAVIGFDDNAAASSARPALTTVRQPLEDLGRLAVGRMLAMLRGEPVPRRETLAARLVVRRSCGCGPVLGRWRAEDEQVTSDHSEQGLAAGVERAAPEVSQRIGRSGWALDLARAYGRSADGAPDGLLQALEEIVFRGLDAGVDPSRFYDVVHAIVRHAQAQGATAAQLGALAESTTQLVGTLAAQFQIGARVQVLEETQILQLMFMPVYVTEESFLEVLRSDLPTLGLRRFFLCLFTDPSARRAELRMHYDLEGRFPLAKPNGPFPATQLLPGGLRADARCSHIVIGLQHRQERIGYAVCDIGPMSPGVYESLSTQVTSVLKLVSLLTEVRRQADALEAKVEERTRELGEAQRQLVDAAHQAGMAEVAVGVLHNVGNLLNSVSVCAEEIAARAHGAHAEGLRKALELVVEHRNDLVGFFSNDPRALLLPDYLEKVSAGFAQDRLHAHAEAQQLLDKISVIRDTIRALQDLARRGEQTVLEEHVSIAETVEATLEILQPLLLREGVEIRRQLEHTLPRVTTERTKVIHVLVNLVKNAVEAMRARPEGERVLTLGGRMERPGWVRITVRDSGEGIAPEHLAQLFSFGFTTKPDGHGFGLHSCALQARQLGGELHAISPGLGQGATFSLVLPVARGGG